MFWWGSPVGLAGNRIWLYFTVIFGIWAENRGRKWELLSGSGISCFYIQDYQGEQRGIWDFNSYVTTYKLLLTSAKSTSWQKWTFCAYSCVRFQVMNGSVPCQVLPNVSCSIIPWLCLVSWDCMRSLSPIGIICVDLWHQWHLSISTFWELASVIMAPDSFWLVFLVFRPFLEGLACFGQDDHTEWRWYWFTEGSIRHHELHITIHYEKDVQAGIPSFGKKVMRPDFKKSEDVESFERDCQVCLQAISWIWVIFFHWYAE